MNPELLRNLWLEASPLRLALIAGLLLLVFAATSITPFGFATTQGAALALYWFFAVLWGTRSAALSVVAEIRERTWDGQKLSSISPWQMVWGKLLGSTAANWFGALLCLLMVVRAAWQEQGLGAALRYGLILLSLGLFAQAVALLSSLALIGRRTGNWRLDTFLCQVAGIGAAFAYYSLWSSIAAFARSSESRLTWWGHAVPLSTFHLVSLLGFLAWSLVGCWRAMRAELRFANGPFVWLGYLAYLAIYNAGFASDLRGPAQLLDLASPAAIVLALALTGPLLTSYGMAFLEPKDPVRLRWLAEQIGRVRIGQAFLALDAWMLSYGTALVLGVALAAVLALSPSAVGAQHPSAWALPVLAMLGFLTRDMAIFVLMRAAAGGKGDFGAVALLGVLYLLLPLILEGLGWRKLDILFLPIAGVSVISAWGEALLLCLWAGIRMGTVQGTKPA